MQIDAKASYDAKERRLTIVYEHIPEHIAEWIVEVLMAIGRHPEKKERGH